MALGSRIWSVDGSIAAGMEPGRGHGLVRVGIDATRIWQRVASMERQRLGSGMERGRTRSETERGVARSGTERAGLAGQLASIAQ